jgi:hypothetical protein
MAKQGDIIGVYEEIADIDTKSRIEFVTPSL